MKQIVADSGGTKTDWCIVDENGNRTHVTTRSYHPKFVDDLFVTQEGVFWSNADLLGAGFDNYVLHFFGSGCFKAEQSAQMKELLEQIGFKNVIVQSDLHGAALALGVANGWCAICGTGSVTFEMQNNQVAKIYGGLGFEIGDEGSGFYFGKLLVEEIRKGNLHYDLVKPFLESEFTERDVLNPVIDAKQKKIYARLPYLLREQIDFESIKILHYNNIRIFAKKYLVDCVQISFVGSYAFYHQNLFRSILREFDIEVIDFLERPIDRLTDNILKDTVN